MPNPDILKTLPCLNCLIPIKSCAFSTTTQRVAPSLISLTLVSNPRLHRGHMAMHFQQPSSKLYCNHDVETPAWMGKQVNVSRKAYMLILTGCVGFRLNSSSPDDRRDEGNVGQMKMVGDTDRGEDKGCSAQCLTPTDGFAGVWGLHVRSVPV